MDNFLLGNATSPAKEISLPANVEVALAAAVRATRDANAEFGGVVTHDPGRYDVWGPVQTPLTGGRRVAAGFSAPRDTNRVGSYHTHPEQFTVWSQTDVKLLISAGSKYAFSVMSNSDGTVVRAIVVLKSTIRDESKLNYGDRHVNISGKEKEMSEEFDNRLAKDANDLHFAVYKRENSTPLQGGKLKLIQYDPNMKDVTP